MRRGAKSQKKSLDIANMIDFKVFVYYLLSLFCSGRKKKFALERKRRQKSPGESSPKLEEIVKYYLEHDNKAARADLSLNYSEASAIAFRSNDSSIYLEVVKAHPSYQTVQLNQKTQQSEVNVIVQIARAI